MCVCVCVCVCVFVCPQSCDNSALTRNPPPTHATQCQMRPSSSCSLPHTHGAPVGGKPSDTDRQTDRQTDRRKHTWEREPTHAPTQTQTHTRTHAHMPTNIPDLFAGQAVLEARVPRLRRPNKCQKRPAIGANKTYVRTFESLPRSFLGKTPG